MCTAENVNRSARMMPFPKKERPCSRACGVKAIGSDEFGRAKIDNVKNVYPAVCVWSAVPFGAISDKSQIYQLARSLKEGNEIIAEIAPAFVGQFGSMEPKDVHAALETLGIFPKFMR